MNKQVLSSQLMDTGLFARVDCSGAPGSPALAFLNTAGHEMVSRLGQAGFEDDIARKIQGELGSIAGWEMGAVAAPLWPHDELEYPEKAPRLLSHLRQQSVHRLLLDIKPSLCWFDGHFPARPILAGVAQLHLAALLAKSLFELDDFPRRITRLKFQSLVVPPCVLELRLEERTAGEICFRIHAKGRDHSQGRLHFAGNRP